MDSNASGSAGYSTESGRHTGTTLTDAAVRQWVPSVLAWPTPRTQASERAVVARPHERNGHKSNLEEVVALHGLPAPATCTHGGTCKPTLNPRFVEWLMGFPIGWTAFEPSETAWPRWLRRMRSEILRLGSSSAASEP